MKTIYVPKSKFKPKTFEYLRQVETDHVEICITDHGKPVVKLTAYTKSDEEILSELRGLVTSYDAPFESVGVDDWEVMG